MKKTKLFTTVLLLLIASVAFVKCQPSDGLPELEHQTKLKSIAFNSLPSSLMKNVNLLSQTSKNNSDDLLIFDQSQIIEVVDSLSNTNFTIKFVLPNQPNNILYNLVVGQDESGNELPPYILKYIIHNLSDIDNGNYIDFSQMKANIHYYSFDQFLLYLENYSTNSSNSDRYSTVDPCNDFSYDGEEITDPDDPNNDDDSNGECQVDVWSNAETGEIFAINWHCTDGSSGGIDFGRTNNCNSDTNAGGGSGINNGNCQNGTIVNGVCVDNGWANGETIVDEPDDPINDVIEFLECFDTSKSATLTIYVAEPNPGSGDTYDGLYAGHTYVSLSQGSEVSTYGYYPVESGVNPFTNNYSQAILGNDGSGNEFYSASITTTLTPAQLQNIINASINFNPDYHLDHYNCTDFAIELGNLAGLGLPPANGSWPGGGYGSNPGTLGEYIWNLSPNGNTTTSTTAGSAPATNKNC